MTTSPCLFEDNDWHFFIPIDLDAVDIDNEFLGLDNQELKSHYMKRLHVYLDNNNGLKGVAILDAELTSGTNVANMIIDRSINYDLDDIYGVLKDFIQHEKFAIAVKHVEKNHRNSASLHCFEIEFYRRKYEND